MSLNSPFWFAVAITAVIGMMAVARTRPIKAPLATRFFLFLGAFLLALAAGGFTINSPGGRDVLVMIDRSASTRGASYRDAGTLKQRLDELLGQTAYRQVDLSDEAAEKTVFVPPKADAVVLFSDAQFDPPATSPPTYIVVDPNLEHPDDAAITRLETRSGSIVAAVRNSGAARQVQITSATANQVMAEPGEHVISAPFDPSASSVSARLSGADLWPENDALSIHIPPPDELQRWWIGTGAPSAAWRALQPADLPTDAASYLAAAAIALNDVPADALSSVQQTRLSQYARDLGGGLLILGGEHAFSNGDYVGTPLESLSPLSSAPPSPQRFWVILVDSSGSMAGPADGGGTRWQRAADAVARLVPRLPPNDLISIGNFARDLRWWSQSQTVSATARLTLPPPGIEPLGPTNLQPVLQTIAEQLQPGRTDIIIVSDADAAIDDPPALALALRSKGARLHLMATADVGRSPLPQLVVLTAGRIVSQPDPKLWAETTLQLFHASVQNRIRPAPATIAFAPELASLPARILDPWNRTWLKADATELASANVDNQHVPLIAKWNLGAGRVAAAAFAPNRAEAETMAALVARPPRDPRYKVSLSASSPLKVSVQAIDGNQYLNDLDLKLTLSDQSNPTQNQPSIRFTQTAPGHYELSTPAPRLPMLATIRMADHVIDRIELPGHYPAEFDHIGNNRPAMQKLAQITGGVLIEPSQTSPIDFHWPRRPIPLASRLAAFGALLVAIGLMIWKGR